MPVQLAVPSRHRGVSHCRVGAIKKMLHLSPTFVKSSRTAAGSLCPQTAAGSRGFCFLGFFILTAMFATEFIVFL